MTDFEDTIFSKWQLHFSILEYQNANNFVKEKPT